MKNQVSALLTLAALAVVATLPASVSAQSIAENVKRAQDRWMKCLQSSYRINRRQQPDPNAAAEMAFQACTTEEDFVWTMSSAVGVPRSGFAGLKAATKQVLIEGK